MKVGSRGGRTRKWMIPLVSLTVVAITWGGWTLRQWHVRSTQQAGMRAAYLSQNYPQVEQFAQNLLTAGSLTEDFVWLAAQAASRDHRYTQAIGWFDRIPASSSRHVEALAATGEISLLSLHQLSEAEDRLQQVLKLDPDHVLARQQLVGLLGLTGQTGEAAQHRIDLIRKKRFTRTDLMLMGLRETALENADQLADFERDAPDDPLTHLARANYEFKSHRLQTAESHLRKVIQARPNLIHAHVLFGKLLLESRRTSELAAWQRHLPQDAPNSAPIWTICGDWCAAQGENQQAIRCYLEAIRRDPLQQEACYHVAPLFEDIKRPELATQFRTQANRLQEFLVAIKRFHSEQDPATIPKIVEHCEALGLIWEAYGWTLAAEEVHSGMNWVSKAKARLEPQLPQARGRVIASANPVTGVKVELYPLPVWYSSTQVPASDSTETLPQPIAIPSLAEARTAEAAIAFRDDAANTGLNFQYFTGHDPGFGGRRVFEFAGGGVGVVDFDLDTWPDLYWAQGCSWPPPTDRDTPHKDRHHDSLFRNRGGQQFQDVSTESRLQETSYSHGVAVGDWNNDGFPDLYIGNAGPNRLYLNLGDGTFADVTNETGVGGQQWTTSCLIADLSGDGLPDLYAANYLAGDKLYERLCAAGGGRTRACTPHDLDPAPDEFYLNLGDGRFAEQSESWGFKVPTGKSLGLLAADFDGSGQLSLFVANDTDGNHFFHSDKKMIPQDAGTQKHVHFEEQALPAGLAFDYEGRSLACMGVAAGDANGDGKLDLFITNYYAESNILYLQQPLGGFLDRANESGLRAPSLDVLGFGTQFLDGDLDGDSDLVVVNGHVDNEQAPGIPYEMLPQFFVNMGSGQFQELKASRDTSPSSLGPWFARKTVGRGLATLDWNRDGRADFAVSLLEHSAALLTNASPNPSRSFVVRMHGTSANRDAIGATVQLNTKNGVQLQQLTAGDGYLASNERILIFGLGEESSAERLSVKWPGGAEQTVEKPQAGNEYRLIEGRSIPTISQLSPR